MRQPCACTGGWGWADETLRDLLTPNRLTSYLGAAGGDLASAIRLYEWNIEASAAVIATTGMVEVVVRKAMDAQLTAWAAARRSQSWLDALPLDQRGGVDIAKARDRATNYGRTSSGHGNVVAELSFGFWRYLTSQRYHASIWVPALRRAFPGGHPDIRERRRVVDRHLANLMLVRNRAVHHEPIHRRDLLADLRTAVELSSWVHEQAGAWVRARSTIPTVVSVRPR